MIRSNLYIYIYNCCDKESKYYLCFECKIGNRDKSWALPIQICCNTNATKLQQWLLIGKIMLLLSQ